MYVAQRSPMSYLPPDGVQGKMTHLVHGKGEVRESTSSALAGQLCEGQPAQHVAGGLVLGLQGINPHPSGLPAPLLWEDLQNKEQML